MSKGVKSKNQRATKKEYTGNDVKRYVGAISEEFRGHIRLVAEQHGGIMRKLEEHDGQFRLVNQQFRRVDEQFRTVHHALGALKEDLEIIKSDIAIIKADVRKRVTYDEFSTLTKRVALLEKKSHRSLRTRTV